MPFGPKQRAAARTWLRKLLTFLATVVAVALCPHLTAHAAKAIIPTGHGRILDTTGTLTPGQKTELARMSEAIDHESGAVILTLMVPSLNGEESIEEFGIRAAETLTPGHHAESKSAILLIARNDHKVRLEVNRFLGQTLTDAKARHLIDALKPQLRTGDYNGAIKIFYSEVRQYTGGKPAAAAEPVPDSAAAQPPVLAVETSPASEHLPLWIGATALLAVAVVLGPFGIWRSRKATGAKKKKKRGKKRDDSDTAPSFWSSEGVSVGSTSSSSDSSDSGSSSGSASSFDGGGSSSDY